MESSFLESDDPFRKRYPTSIFFSKSVQGGILQGRLYMEGGGRMRITESPNGNEWVRIRIESIDDLWYLHQVIRNGVIVGSHTFRKVESRDDMIRPESSARKRIYLIIKVEDTYFHPFTDSLRIKGLIIEAPPDISGHHTFNIDPGSYFDVNRGGLSDADIDLLKESGERSGSEQAVIISIDDSSCTIHRLRDYGLEFQGNLEISGGKRFGGSDKWEAFMFDVIRTLEPVYSPPTPLIIIGPSFFKEKLAKRLREMIKEPDVQIITMNASAGGVAGIKEAFINRNDISGVLKRSRNVREVQMIEDLLSRIGKGKGAVYGEEEVRRAIGFGAVETLLVSDRVFRDGLGRELMEL
jgi:protein pelota